jgi:hypothetical protein
VPPYEIGPAVKFLVRRARELGYKLVPTSTAVATWRNVILTKTGLAVRDVRIDSVSTIIDSL